MQISFAFSFISCIIALMNGVTIDHLDIKSHRRYAEDQKRLDPTFLEEANLVAPHPEIAGTSTIYSSQLEQLFETDVKNIPWACFAPPPKYNVQAKRFFTYRLLPTVDWFDSGSETDEEGQEQQEEKEGNPRKKIESFLDQGNKEKHSDLQHKESGFLMNLIDTIQHFDVLLKHINAKKSQYHKG